MLVSLLSLPFCLPAQTSGPLNIAEPAKVSARRNSTLEVKLDLSLRPGYHVNSNHPSEQYLIPLRLTWEDTLVKTDRVEYPKAIMQKFDFSEKPLSVYEGAFALRTQFRVPANAVSGPNIVLGKLRYQACSNTACLPPKTVEVHLPVVIQ